MSARREARPSAVAPPPDREAIGIPMTRRATSNGGRDTAIPTEMADSGMPAPITPGGEPTDDIFAEPSNRPTDFAFDATTVRVFDNMVSRSVPFYGEIQRMTAELAEEFAVPGSTVYDLGCSTGTTLRALEPHIDLSVSFVG